MRPFRLKGLLILAALPICAGAVEQTPLLVDVTVNYRHQGIALLMSDGSDTYYADTLDLAKWGVRGPYADLTEYRGRDYSRLDSLGDIEVDYDSTRAKVALVFPAHLLPSQNSSLRQSQAPPPTSSTGAYLDYDWTYTDGYESYASGLIAPTIFSPLGALHTQVLYRGYDLSFVEPELADPWVRLDTTFTRDIPLKMRSLRFGDVIGRPGPWGGALRIGGVQLASNFSTQPAFVTFPTPSMFGETRLPSSLDLYVDDRLRYQRDLEPGSFRIDDVPVVTGSGQMQMVVTDILGREMTYTQDFYVSPELLRTGLSEYSYTLGAIRKNFGYESNNYGDIALLATHRYGVNDRLTVGARAELGPDTQHVSGTADWSPGDTGVLTAGVGLSSSSLGDGVAWNLGYQYHGSEFRVGALALGTSRDFRLIDGDGYRVPPKTQIVLNGGWSGRFRGSIGLTFVQQDYHNDVTRRVVTLSHNQTLFGNYSMSVFGSYTSDRESSASVGLTVSRALGKRRSASAYAFHGDDNTRVRMEAQRSLTTGPSVGYRVGTVIDTENQFDANVVGQTDHGRYSLDGEYLAGETSWRTSAAGSIAWLAGRPYFTREINEGFAVAKIGNFENVRVYVENQEVGQSDSHGRVLLPTLRPYETNRIRIEPMDLPLSSEVPIVTIEVAPSYRSGVVIDFPVTSPRSALAQAMLPNGEPVPDGSAVFLTGRSVPSVVGMNGMIYVVGADASTEVIIENADGRCSFTVELPEPSESLPHLGAIVCAAIP